MVLDAYTYVFAIGSMFALLEAYNNGASTYPPPRICSSERQSSSC